jgi:hypothetical protein
MSEMTAVEQKVAALGVGIPLAILREWILEVGNASVNFASHGSPLYAGGTVQQGC